PGRDADRYRRRSDRREAGRVAGYLLGRLAASNDPAPITFPKLPKPYIFRLFSGRSLIGDENIEKRLCHITGATGDWRPSMEGAVEDRALIEPAFNLNLKGVQAALAKGADPNAVKIERSPGSTDLKRPVLLSAVFGHPTQDSWQEWNNADPNKDE